MGRTRKPDQQLLRAFFRELVCCLGRVSARHQLPADAVWELVKGFYILYLRVQSQAGWEGKGPDLPFPARHLRPHPGIVRLLRKLDLEDGE